MNGSDTRDRRSAARELRRQGHSIRAIADEIGASKSSVSTWCSDIELTADQAAALARRAQTANRRSRDTQWRRRNEIASIELEAAALTEGLAPSPLWTAGVALYWAEGGKTERRLSMSNADPELLKLFMRWTHRFHDLSVFSCSINLHADNDEEAARKYWSQALGIPLSHFTKTYIKPNGTGHRKNHLEHGVARVTARRSTDAWIRTMVWISDVSKHL